MVRQFKFTIIVAATIFAVKNLEKDTWVLFYYDSVKDTWVLFYYDSVGAAILASMLL